MKIVLSVEEFLEALRTKKLPEFSLPNGREANIYVDDNGKLIDIGNIVENGNTYSITNKPKHKPRKHTHDNYKRTDAWRRGKNKKPFKFYTPEEKAVLDAFFRNSSNHYDNGALISAKVEEIARKLGRTKEAIVVYFTTHGYKSTRRYRGTVPFRTR